MTNVLDDLLDQIYKVVDKVYDFQIDYKTNKNALLERIDEAILLLKQIRDYIISR